MPLFRIKTPIAPTEIQKTRSLSFTARGIYATLIATVDLINSFSDLYVASQSLNDSAEGIDSALEELARSGYIVRIEDLTDWDRVHAMTEEEIERNALADPDALPFDDDWEDAIVAYPVPR